ncbi:MAG: SDR family oxidoreductase [Pseudomonadota bacterium]
MAKLEGKTCLVTGAARGIGLAVVDRFLAEGAQVILTDKDDSLGSTEATARGITFLPLDVAQEADWKRVADEVPTLDVLVNNAGVTGFEDGPCAHDPETVSLEDWRAVHAVNLDGTFLGCRYGISAMKAAGHGSIINIASRSGMVGIPAASAYASSKAAIRNHTKSVALYCAEKGWAIRCNAICPAAILTPMWEPMIGDGPDREERMASFVADTPLRRFGTSEEVAAACAYLASDESAYTTGTELILDGGLLAGAAASPEPAD